MKKNNSYSAILKSSLNLFILLLCVLSLQTLGQVDNMSRENNMTGTYDAFDGYAGHTQSTINLSGCTDPEGNGTVIVVEQVLTIREENYGKFTGILTLKVLDDGEEVFGRFTINSLTSTTTPGPRSFTATMQSDSPNLSIFNGTFNGTWERINTRPVLTINLNGTGSTGPDEQCNYSGTLKMSSVSCPVKPLTQITDAEALRFEAANGNIVERDEKKGFQSFMNTRIAAIEQDIGENLVLESAFRPYAYQAHLQEVFRKFTLLNNLSYAPCSALYATVYDEFSKHGLAKQEPATGGYHPLGMAIDVKFGSMTTSKEAIIEAAASYSLVRIPKWAKDPNHFYAPLGGFLHSTEFSSKEDNEKPGNVEAAVQISDITSDSNVIVQFTKQTVNNNHVYSYKVINNDSRQIKAVEIGQKGLDGGAQLLELPVNWTFENGLSDTSTTSPTGWNADLITIAESDYHKIIWESNSLTRIIQPLQSVSGFSVILPSEDITYQNSSFNIVFVDGSTSTGLLTPPPTTYTISGKVTNSGNPLSNVSVALSGSSSATTQTDSSGNYSFLADGMGNYTVTPSRPNFAFSPPNVSFNNLTNNQTANFVGTSTCSYSLSSSSINLPSSSSTGTVNVTTAAGCAWTATTTDNWISITDGASGTGNGKVSYSVVENTGVQRSGIITIAGKPFTITQFEMEVACPSMTINSGQTVNGTLQNGDCDLGDGTFYDAYTFNGTIGQKIYISMNSSQFDTYLFLLQGDYPNYTNLDENDDGGGGSNSRIPATSGFFILPSSGIYTILANSFDVGSIGSYTLSLNQEVIGFSVSGMITYGITEANQMPSIISGASLNTTGSSVLSVISGASGAYQLSGLTAGGNYTVTPSKTGEVKGINSLDATRIQQHRVGLTNLTANQLIAADTDGNGAVNSLDATRIQQRLIGITDQNIIGQWKFVPGSKQYNSASSNLTGENYQAILVGEVSGNWASAASFADDSETEEILPKQETLNDANWENAAGRFENELAEAIAERMKQSADLQSNESKSESAMMGASVNVSLPTIPLAFYDSTITIPVTIGAVPAGSPIESFDFTVFYDPTLLQLTSPAGSNAGTLSANCSVLANSPTAGGVIVSGACATGITTASGGVLYNLTFKVIGAARQTALSFTNPLTGVHTFQFNSGSPAANTMDGSVTVAQAPSAASVSVSGKVTTVSGRGIRNVLITMTDSQGNVRTVQTTAFGYYRFDNVAAGETITVTAKARRYRFSQSSIVRTTNDSVSNADFVSEP